ncbi:acyltransferase [Pseudoalteromonas fuliginea]
MKIQSLQILRALAAWLVVYHHYMQIFHNFNSSSLIGDFFSSRGGFGVDLFFVLSGFMMYLAASRPSADGWSFFIKRLFRVFPTYWFFTFIIIIAVALMPNTFIYNQYTAYTLIQSLFFIPHESASGLGVYPVLTVGWTLNYEVLFYSILAVCLAAFKRKGIYICCALILLFPIVFYSFDNVTMSVIKNPKMWQFVFGMAIGYIFLKYKIIEIQLFKTGLISLIAGGIILSGILGYGLIHTTISASLIVIGFILINNLFNEKNLLTQFLIKLGDYSYSTYLAHILVLGVLFNFFGDYTSILKETVVIILLSLATYTVSYFSYKYIENSSFIDALKVSLLNKKVQSTKK